MSIEFDDRELRLIGNGVRHLGFYDDDRTLRAYIYLDANNNLNVGGLQLSTISNDEGSGIDLADVPLLAIAASSLLNNERVIAMGDGLRATDAGGGNNYTMRVEAADLIGNGLQATSNNIALQTPGTLSQGSSNSASGSHTHAITASSNPGAAAYLLKSTAAGALTLEQLNVDNVRLDGNTLSAQTGDLTLTAQGGDVVLASAVNIGADNFVSQLTGWRVTYAGAADFRNIYADELHVKAFVADIEQALAGGQIISKSVALLSRDFAVPVQGDITLVGTVSDFVAIAGDHTAAIDVGQSFIIVGSTGNNGTYSVASVQYVAPNTRIFTNQDITDATADGEVRFRQTLYVEDLPGFENTQVFADNDWIRLRVIDRSGGGLVVADVWGTVLSYSDLTGGEQSWIFTTRDDGGVGGETVNAGALALDYGASGDGWHEITALDSDGPYAQIVTWETDPSNSANYTLRSRLGNLDGVTDSDFPSIGGWGLYSTSAYLKGELIAAGGDIVIGDDGISIEAPQAEDTSTIQDITVHDGAGLDYGRLIFGISGGDSYLGIIATPDTGGDSQIEIFARDDSGDTTGFRLSGSSSTDPNLTAIVGGTTTAFFEPDRVVLQSGISLALLSGNATIIGDVGVGTGSPSFRLDARDNVDGYVARFWNDGNASNRRGIQIQAGQDANPSAALIALLDGDGGVIGSVSGDGAGGVDYNVSSDERIKQDIEPLGGALDRVLALRPVSYRGKGAARSGRKTPGLIAQEVMAAIPEAARYDEESDLYSIAYNKLIPHLIGAIQEQNARIATLEAR